MSSGLIKMLIQRVRLTILPFDGISSRSRKVAFCEVTMSLLVILVTNNSNNQSQAHGLSEGGAMYGSRRGARRRFLTKQQRLITSCKTVAIN